MELKSATKKKTVKGCWGKQIQKKTRRVLVPRLLCKCL